MARICKPPRKGEVRAEITQPTTQAGDTHRGPQPCRHPSTLHPKIRETCSVHRGRTAVARRVLPLQAESASGPRPDVAAMRALCATSPTAPASSPELRLHTKSRKGQGQLRCLPCQHLPHALSPEQVPHAHAVPCEAASPPHWRGRTCARKGRGQKLYKPPARHNHSVRALKPHLCSEPALALQQASHRG